MDILPNELLIDIFTYLDKDIRTIKTLNHKYNNVIKMNEKQIKFHQYKRFLKKNSFSFKCEIHQPSGYVDFSRLKYM